MSVVETLSNPLKQLSILPNSVKWRGDWEETAQYYQYDVVISSTIAASFILTGKTSLIGGSDPSLNTDWTEFSPSATGVQQVDVVPPGIINTGTATFPVLENGGVIEIQEGDGITLTGTKDLYTITNKNITEVFPLYLGSGSGPFNGWEKTTIPANGGIGTIPYAPTSTNPNTSEFYNDCLTGANSWWMIDLSHIMFSLLPTITRSNVNLLTNRISIGITNTIQPPIASTEIYVVPAASGGIVYQSANPTASGGVPWPIVNNLGKIVVNTAAIRFAMPSAQIFSFFAIENISEDDIQVTSFSSALILSRISYNPT